MNRMALAATAVVALNLAVAIVHGLSHARADVPLEPWQMAFVQVTVFALPLLSAVLYWTPLRRLAAALLASTMLASLLFGVWFHFIADTPDHVSHRSADGPGTLFVVTAALLVPAEMLGAAFGAWSWRRLRAPSA
jgi:hypothetical protein